MSEYRRRTVSFSHRPTSLRERLLKSGMSEAEIDARTGRIESAAKQYLASSRQAAYERTKKQHEPYIKTVRREKRKAHTSHVRVLKKLRAEIKQLKAKCRKLAKHKRSR